MVRNYSTTIKYDTYVNEFKKVIQTFPNVTARQMFYQLVVSGLIQNSLRDYKRMDAMLVKARDKADIDWSCFEDRSRMVHKNQGDYSSIADFKKTIKAQWKLWNNYMDIWINQKYHVEIFLEKDAILMPIIDIAKKYQVNVCPVKGYSSYTYLGNQGSRLNLVNKDVIILYIGDFDPSGLDLQRSIEDRLNSYSGGSYVLDRIALTWNQIQQYQLPSYYVKVSDKRTPKYVSLYGNSCYEVESLNPKILQSVLEAEILKYFDLNRYSKLQMQIKLQKQELRKWLNRK